MRTVESVHIMYTDASSSKGSSYARKRKEHNQVIGGFCTFVVQLDAVIVSLRFRRSFLSFSSR